MSVAPRVARFLAALAETERLPPERLLAYQRRLLETLLRHARAETAHYSDILAPVFRADNTIDWERWQEIPILRRAEAQALGDGLKARTLPLAAGAITEKTSSGSTAEPFRYQTTALQSVGAACASERFLHWHGVAPEKLTGIIWAPDDPATAAYPEGGPERGWRIGIPESRAIDLTISTPVADQIEWLTRKGVGHLLTYPTNLGEIGRVARQRGTPLALDALMTHGEMTSTDTRDAIRAAFGRDAIDRYGSTEVSLISATCPHSGLHHIMAELVLIEIVDEDGRLVPPGAMGRIIATPFYNLAMPLIRYDMGDYGALAPEPCGCGRSLPLFERIYGRRRNIFRFSDGTAIWPVLQSWIVQRWVPHRQFQVVQVEPDRIEYRYVPLEPGQPVDVAGLTDYARSQLHPSVVVDAVAVAEIPRSAGGKYEDYISLVG